uniref:Coat protein n=1 Tax=Trichogramma kaykai TaxID=54128 RepID=A0ABD2XMC8_9HYME
MAFLHSHSSECMTSSLDLFSLPPTQTSIESSNYVHFKPISSLSAENDAPIEFVVPAASDYYLDLAHTMLHVKVKIGPLQDVAADNQRVGPVNNFLHSIWAGIEIFFNQKLVSSCNSLYPYRAYIETLLNYNDDAKKSHLTSTLWYVDRSGRFEAAPEVRDADRANSGLLQRQSYTLNSAPLDMIGHLHCDVFNQDKMLINGVEMRVRMVRSKDAFCLMDSTPNGRFKVSIEEATLIVRRAKISPSVLLAHANTLARSTVKMPLTRVEIKSFTLPAGILNTSIDNLTLGQCPKRVIIGLVDNRGFNGNRAYNPFNFQHFDLNYLALYVDGVQVPSKALQPRFGASPLYIEAFQTLFTGTGIHYQNEGNGIDRSIYPLGHFLLAFDLTPDFSANLCTHWNLVRTGSLRLELGFENALIATVNCIAFLEYDNVIEIDANRSIVTDFTT